MDIQKTIILMPIVGVLLIASYGFGASIATASEVNQIKSLEILTTTAGNDEVVDSIDMGTGDSISSIILNFKGSLSSGTTVDISLKDSSGSEIGNGSETLSSQTSVVTITLTDTITAAERPTMTSVSITI